MSATQPEQWLDRMGVRLRGVLEYLDRQGGSAKYHDVLDYVGGLLEFTDYEREVDGKGTPKWWRDTNWYTTNLVKPGWLAKDGVGNWTITDRGREALQALPDPADFYRESERLYKEWKSSQPTPAKRRAWLVRGSSVLGVNVVPEWLADGFCSLAGSQLEQLPSDVDEAALRAQAARDYGHLKQHVLKDKVDEIVAFVLKMRPGDLVVTSAEGQVYVGDITGDLRQIESEGGRSNLRRAVEWRNADAPIDYADLPAPLPAAFQAGDSVVDLTENVALIDSLGATGPDDTSAPEAAAETKRHERLRDPSEDLADALFVERPWLADVRDLLNERRQLIFYGPPGTGKTFIARKLAADLVGPEQVRLVQFHPAYTYEDFFEGYRPSAGATGGTIGFELKPGPFRQLVERAREHSDQAFVLIIDEINRANLAKVFGELYFLLEYRDQAIDLLYSSDESFTLPPNVYLIGTMNTADRSIALVDSAMRRRFAFVELSPDQEPTRSLLRRWSAKHDLGAVAADLLDALNARIDDPDFRIGPSYFMTSTGPDAHSRERLDRIWRTSILPLLQEHHYGQWESVRGRYALDRLLPAEPQAMPEGEVPDVAPAPESIEVPPEAAGA